MAWINKLRKLLNIKEKKTSQSIVVEGHKVNGSISISDGKVTIGGKTIEEYEKGASVYILIQGNIENGLKVEGSAIVEGSISGEVTVGTSLTCQDIKGNATSGTSLKCGNVGNNAEAKTSIVAKDINGNARSGTSIKAEVINGDTKAGTSIKIG